MKKRGFLRSLKAILPSSSVITDAVALRPYETDGLTALRELPVAVVLPTSEEELERTLRICSAYEVEVVPRGSGTGLSGGARPNRGGIVLGLSKLDRIIEIDADNACARVQAGVRNSVISEAAQPYGLFFAPDPSSQIVCSIGGNVAENAGGVHCLKYGVTSNNVVALTAYTIDGARFEIGGYGADWPGIDLLSVLVGSEGMLAIVTEVTVKLLPLPEEKAVILAGFDTEGHASDAVAALVSGGYSMSGLEMMDRLAVEAAEAYCAAGYPVCDAILLCEVDGTAAEVSSLQQHVMAVMESCGARDVRLATTAEDQKALWAGRKAAFPAMGRISPDYYCVDGTIPRSSLALVLATIRELATGVGLSVANVFHAGDGNLHPMILYDANIPGQLEKAEELGGQILELCVAVGGTVTGEHGVGLEKLDPMCSQFSADEITQFHQLKAAFDPPGLMNPGKAIPTLHRCVDKGGMHVHAGRVPFLSLSRF